MSLAYETVARLISGPSRRLWRRKAVRKHLGRDLYVNSPYGAVVQFLLICAYAKTKSTDIAVVKQIKSNSRCCLSATRGLYCLPNLSNSVDRLTQRKLGGTSGKNCEANLLIILARLAPCGLWSPRTRPSCEASFGTKSLDGQAFRCLVSSFRGVFL